MTIRKVNIIKVKIIMALEAALVRQTVWMRGILTLCIPAMTRIAASPAMGRSSISGAKSTTARIANSPVKIFASRDFAPALTTRAVEDREPPTGRP